MNRKADITIGQLLQISPQMCRELTKNKIKSYMIEPTKTGFYLANLNVVINNEEDLYTTTRAEVIIDNKSIDCGTCKCIMNRNTKELLGLEIDSLL